MVVYVVNPGGVVHSVEDTEAARVLAQRGFREATAEEVATWHTTQGLDAPQAPKARSR